MSIGKYLCIATLVALCLCLTTSAVLGADSWRAIGSAFPNSLGWDQAAAVSVDAQNNGTTNWNSSYGLASVEGVTTSAFAIDRWGLRLAPIVGVTVAPTSTFLFEFTITGPAFTTLKYEVPVSATEPGVADFLTANFMLAHPITPTLTPITTDTSLNTIVVSRFPDIQPGTDGYWARFWVEELAGRVPLVVQGFPNGTYGPTIQVARDAMAVFVARALKLTLPPFERKFRDVPEDYWARPWIEALADTDIVQGYDDGTYRPTLVVNRDAMAVFVARGMAGGEALVPTGPATPHFPDVPSDYWAYKHIEYAVAHGVVQGYPDGKYQPLVPVDRAQMAVFIWRGFMMSAGTPVVLAGPSTTSAGDPATLPYLAWSTDETNPAFAYVAFDAVRLDPSMVPTGTWEVRFELRGGATPTTVAASRTISLTAAELDTIKDAAMASGDPYLVLSWDLSTVSVPAGSYHLVVLVKDEQGVLQEVLRQPHVSFGP